MVSSLIGWLLSLKRTIYIYIGAVVLFGLLILKAYISGRRDGSLTLKREIERRNEKIQNEWTKIDNAPSDYNDAIERLRKRSTKAGYKQSS